MIDVRMFTVGPVQENCYIVRTPGSEQAVIIDPGDEADRLLDALKALEISTVEAILLTHTHFDHVGAVAPVARATGAPVYCPELETQVLADINAYVRWPGFGPFESYDADHTVSGGETLELAGMTFEVSFVPGHSPGHVSYGLRDEPDDATAVQSGEAGGRADREVAALFSGDVLFQGSVGRVDLPGGDWPTLLASIDSLLQAYPGETTVYPGHMGLTTLAAERDTNPFLRELAHHS
ncbi:MAG TPA: MBL fold metallo-hydrolase [Solirubrobacteraceae bacterium]|nr:MBL fold metallo-hydrolase [Solirubrobacteraceae bacterium]